MATMQERLQSMVQYLRTFMNGAEIAEETKVSEATISRILNGVDIVPNLETYQKIQDTFERWKGK